MHRDIMNIMNIMNVSSNGSSDEPINNWDRTRGVQML